MILEFTTYTHDESPLQFDVAGTRVHIWKT